MNKVFLSYSRKQRGYVDIIAKRLGKQNVIYDTLTFEKCNKTLDEIFESIEESGIFVYFISEESLESEWVKKELNIAEQYIQTKKIKRFFPVIIDDKIIHSDDRIPDWIKKEYNIRFISRPSKVHDLIRQSLRIIYWDVYPDKSEYTQLFIGRTKQIKEYEERIFDIDKLLPRAIFVNGMSAIGRKKFIFHCLVKSNKIRKYYLPPSINLDSRNSIEDLIVRIYGLGFSQLDNSFILNLSTKSINTKIQILVKLLEELYKNNDILFINDNLSLVDKRGYIVDWFLDLIQKIDHLNGILICVISKSRVYYRQILNNNKIFSINIPELEKNERISLFLALLEIKKISLNKEDLISVSSQFKGFPEQIFYAISLIEYAGINYVSNNLHEIIEFNFEKVSKIIRNYEKNIIAMQLLKILSELEFVSFNILEVIFKHEFETVMDILTKFSNEFIIEFIGNSKEFIRLNDTIKDFIQRLNLKLLHKYVSSLEKHVKINIEDYSDIQRDLSDYVISVKEALKNGFSIPDELLIPSNFVNAMRELYNYERRYDDVITLADRVLINKEFYDSRIIHEIQYWLCLSLARKRDTRILQEVQKIDGPDHDFLLGFYYRLIGKHEAAIDRFNSILSKTRNFYRAKRELVQVYLNIDDYEKALDLAKENYESEKNNPYHIHSYIKCLIRVCGKNAEHDIEELLADLNMNLHEKAPEMYLTSLSQYNFFVEKDFLKSLDNINNAIDSYPKKIYPYLTKLDILRKHYDDCEMGATLSLVEKQFSRDSDIFNKYAYIHAKILFLVKNGKTTTAYSILNKKVKNKFSQKIYDYLESLISSD